MKVEQSNVSHLDLRLGVKVKFVQISFAVGEEETFCGLYFFVPDVSTIQAWCFRVDIFHDNYKFYKGVNTYGIYSAQLKQSNEHQYQEQKWGILIQIF